MFLDKNEIKNTLTIEQIIELVDSFGGEGIQINDNIVTFKTICHNGDSHKLYYYDNTHLFKCYTNCPETEGFDIFELIRKIKTRESKKEWSLPQAMRFIASYFNISTEGDMLQDFDGIELQDWEIFEKHLKEKKESPQVQLKILDKNLIKFLPKPHISHWETEGISHHISINRGICFNGSSQTIIIPHYDKDNNLIGIRERTVIQEQEKYGKYKPATINGIMYNHPLGFNLYNLNNSKDNIKILRKAIVFESEKSCLKYASMFGADNDISVACCGSSITPYQLLLLVDLGVEEIIIAFDKQFQEIGNEEFKKWTKKLKQINNRYKPYCNISFMFDREDILNYKSSPIDEGYDKFIELLNKRFQL